MDLSFTDEDRAARREVRAWMPDNIPTTARCSTSRVPAGPESDCYALPPPRSPAARAS